MTAVSALVRDVRAAFPSAIAFLKLRATGAGFYDGDGTTARRSLWAFPLALPFMLLIEAMILAQPVAGMEPRPNAPIAFVVLTHIAMMTLQWYLFPVIAQPFARALDRSARYPHFVTLYNWTQFAQVPLIALPVQMLIYASGGNADVAGVATLVLVVVLMAQRCIVNAITLDVGPLPACVLATMDLGQSFLVQALADAIILQAANAG